LDDAWFMFGVGNFVWWCDIGLGRILIISLWFLVVYVGESGYWKRDHHPYYTMMSTRKS
jgi:hypothetical protein